MANTDKPETGSCLQFGDSALIEKNEAVFDRTEDDGMVYSIEVGENFGCIHHEEME